MACAASRRFNYARRRRRHCFSDCASASSVMGVHCTADCHVHCDANYLGGSLDDGGVRWGPFVIQTDVERAGWLPGWLAGERPTRRVVPRRFTVHRHVQSHLSTSPWNERTDGRRSIHDTMTLVGSRRWKRTEAESTRRRRRWNAAAPRRREVSEQRTMLAAAAFIARQSTLLYSLPHRHCPRPIAAVTQLPTASRLDYSTVKWNSNSDNFFVIIVITVEHL